MGPDEDDRARSPSADGARRQPGVESEDCTTGDELHGGVRLPAPLEAGEDPHSPYVDDADHWVAVYSELLEFRANLLWEIDRQAMDMAEVSGPGIAHIRQVLKLDLERLRLHLEYWRARREELRARSHDA